MAMRTCVKCGRAENPLARLRFTKSRIDGNTYCENCAPMDHSLDLPRRGVEGDHLPSLRPATNPSAGFVVIECPSCQGLAGTKRPCADCAGYRAVRVDPSILNVYRPKPARETLLED